jgi:SWI/SNF-related matrix-associated actin-dependent regulator 1 of chromatin subfamily A
LPTKEELRGKHPLSETFEAKRDAVIESVIAEMADGAKVIVFTLLRASTEKFAKAIDIVMNGRKHGAQMRAQAAKLYTAHGAQSDKVRFELARKFREHNGAAVFVATIDALQVAVNLAGATSVHFIDLHWSPSALCQAEDRAYDVDTKGVTVIYYIVKDSVDEAVQQVVLPKLQTVDRMTNEEGAQEMHLALSTNNNEQDIMDVLDSLAAMVDGDDVAWEEREP